MSDDDDDTLSALSDDAETARAAAPPVPRARRASELRFEALGSVGTSPPAQFGGPLIADAPVSAAAFEAEVLAFDDARSVHFVRYAADGYECEESLIGGPGTSPWRPVIKTTARGAASARRSPPGQNSSTRPKNVGSVVTTPKTKTTRGERISTMTASSDEKLRKSFSR